MKQTVRVISAPEAIVTPADIVGSHAANDPAVAALIQAVTEDIDGPSGWLGRCFGPQVLRLTQDSFCGRNMLLPYGPVIEVENIAYLDAADNEFSVPDDAWRMVDDRIWFAAGFSFPSLSCAPDALRIEYQAGYNDEDASNEGGTGPVPERARQAIIATVQHLKSTFRTENLFLRSDQVEGIGMRQYVVSDQANVIIRQMTDRLLSGLRVYTV